LGGFAIEKAVYPDYPLIGSEGQIGYGSLVTITVPSASILLTEADRHEHRGEDGEFDKNINKAIGSLLWPDRIGLL